MDVSLMPRKQCFALVLPVFLLGILASGDAEAIQCYQCHGTDNTSDYRPLDSLSRNPATGGFKGNHRTHMGPNAGPSTCAACHPGSGEYGTSHSNGLIEISPAINNSPLPAVYRNGTTAIPQTTAPHLGSCSNVNCHFERETPAWGSPSLTVPEGCSTCHGSPPDGGDSGPAGSHSQHDLYFPGVTGCGQCHADHATETTPFAHATSAGRRNLVVSIQNAYTSAKATYSGPIDDYLPKSGNNMFGSCVNVYCHSTGTGTSAFAPNITPVWGTPLPGDCSGCHGGDYRSGIEIATGSHTIHAGRDYYGQYVYDCSTCHSATAADSRTIGNRENHTNRKIDVVMKQGYGGTYSTTGHDPGGAVGSCSNVYCHSNVQPNGGIGGPTAYGNPTWGVVNSINCGGCHAGDAGHAHGGAKISTGSHARHLAYAFTTTGNATKCMICHKYTDQPFQTGCFSGAYGNTVCHTGAGAKHSNGVVDVRLDPVFGNISAYMGTPAPGDGYSNCVNTYCHSDGTSTATGTLPQNTSTSWGTGALGCNACHGNPPSYTGGSPKANSHAKHAGYSCSSCHYATTTTGATITGTSAHVNKAFDLSGAPGTTFTYTFAATGGSCSGISCHRGGSATWGTTLPCDSCHDLPPATPSHIKHFSGTTSEAGYGDLRVAQDFSPTASGYIMNCGNCHPIDRRKHGNGTVEVELHDPEAAAGSIKSLNPSAAAYANGTTIHTDSRGFTYTNGTCSNVYCHSYNEWTTPGGVAPYSNYTTYWPPNLVITRKYQSVAWNGPSLTCSGCHAYPPQTRFPENQYGSGDSHSWIAADGVEARHIINMGYDPMSCRTCHYETVRTANIFTLYTSNNLYMRIPGDVPINNYSKHVNGSGSVDFDTVNPVVYRTYWSGNVVMNLSGAGYNPARKTCSNVSCHQEQTSIKWGVPYNDWTDQCYVCHSY